jgi:ATP-binding cassette subfamily B protein
VEIARTALLLLIATPILFAHDARLTALSLMLLPLVFVSALVFFRRVQRLFLQVDEAEAKMTGVLQENLTGIRVVRAFARQDEERVKFAGVNGAHRDLHYRLIRLLGAYWALSDVLCLTQMGVALFAAAYAYVSGAIGLGTLFVFTTYVGLVIWPVRQLGRILADAGKATVSLDRLAQILEETEEDALADGGPAFTGDLAFDDVHFAFGTEGRPVLQGLSFRVRAGETVALLGAPGAGKSTAIQLLLRLYDPSSGVICLDGRDLATFGREHVRRNVAAVLQEPFLYSATVGANVRVGRAAASDEELVSSATDACVHGAIETFERGYDTLVGERGVTLSGGQRQRVALARALLKDAPVLVLDDALSAVDTKTEAAILDALRRRRGRRTTILIAHRLSTIAHADRILLLEGGRVAQQGTHRELIAREGPYARLWRIQGALEEQIDADLDRTRT